MCVIIKHDTHTVARDNYTSALIGAGCAVCRLLSRTTFSIEFVTFSDLCLNSSAMYYWPCLVSPC